VSTRAPPRPCHQRGRGLFGAPAALCIWDHLGAAYAVLKVSRESWGAGIGTCSDVPSHLRRTDWCHRQGVEECEKDETMFTTPQFAHAEIAYRQERVKREFARATVRRQRREQATQAKLRPKHAA
jgi:hypothetical protein